MLRLLERVLQGLYGGQAQQHESPAANNAASDESNLGKPGVHSAAPLSKSARRNLPILRFWRAIANRIAVALRTGCARLG